MMHCFEHERLTPDLVVFGKGIGGGLPLSAVVGPKEIMDHAPAFALQTTAGNPVATSAGNAVLKTIESEGLVKGSARKALPRRAAGAQQKARDHRRRARTRRRPGEGPREPVPATKTAKIIYRGYELGVAFSYVGLKANVLEFMPPLTLTEDEVAEGIAIVDQAITDVNAGKVRDADVASFMTW